MKYQRIINKLITQGIIEAEEADLYAYGLEITILYTISITISAFISILMHGTFIYLIFLAAFLPLRRSAGGFHFDSSFVCQFFSQVLIVLPQIIIPKILQTNISPLWFSALFVIDLLILHKKGAIVSKNRFSDEEMINKFTKKSFHILVIYFIVFILFTFFNKELVAYTLLYVVMLQGILLLIPEKK